MFLHKKGYRTLRILVKGSSVILKNRNFVYRISKFKANYPTRDSTVQDKTISLVIKNKITGMDVNYSRLSKLILGQMKQKSNLPFYVKCKLSIPILSFSLCCLAFITFSMLHYYVKITDEQYSELLAIFRKS